MQLRAIKHLREETAAPLRLLGAGVGSLGESLHAVHALPVEVNSTMTRTYLDDTTSVFGRLLQLYDSRRAPDNEAVTGTSNFSLHDDGGGGEDLQRDLVLFSTPIDTLSTPSNQEQHVESDTPSLDDANAELANVFVADEIEANVWSYRSQHGGRNALADACRRGCLEVVHAILQPQHRAQASKLLHDTDDEGLTPLAIAASFVEPRRCVAVVNDTSSNNADLESCFPSEVQDTAAGMVEALLAFDRRFNDGQIDLVLALPLAAGAGASPTTLKVRSSLPAFAFDLDLPQSAGA